MIDHYIKNAILKCSSDQTGVSPELMKGASRKPVVCRARYLAVMTCHYADISQAETARLLGHKDHSTIKTGLDRARELHMHTAALAVLSRAQVVATKERESSSDRRARMMAAVLTIRTGGEAA